MGSHAGIDWASAERDVLSADPGGEELLAVTFAHDEDAVSALCGALACFDVELVAIQRPNGLLVDRLLEAGVRMLALHPNQVKARAIGSARQAGSPIALTGSCSVSWRGLIGTASGCSSPTLIRTRRCGR